MAAEAEGLREYDLVSYHPSQEHGARAGGNADGYIHTDYQRFQMPVYCSTLDPVTGEIEAAAGMMPRLFPSSRRPAGR
ncbi:hypothetical protein [Paenibacillus sp. 22594]|uniref:hypothetical protein n=1 Tax=Paenibacillus sp. 22594 TaxID=3453947 RepID=UPI003F84167D